jgi:putative FmdB family regulatory protein
MPTYDYECQKCGHQQEQWFSMADRPSSVPCPCGKKAIQVILEAPESFVRFRPYEFDPKKVVGNNGKSKGRSAAKQHEGYRRHFDGVAKNVRRANRSASKSAHSGGGFQYLGGMPGEMYDSIGQQEGDKEAVAKDPVSFLKKTGMYVGEGE